MPGGADRDLVGIDRAAAGVDPDYPPAFGADRGNLAILDDVDAPRIGGAGIAPGDRVVARHPAAPLQRAAEYRIAGVARNVEDRAKPLDRFAVEPFGVDLVEAVGAGPAHPLADVGLAV